MPTMAEQMAVIHSVLLNSSVCRTNRAGVRPEQNTGNSCPTGVLVPENAEQTSMARVKWLRQIFLVTRDDLVWLMGPIW
jgi:hypothetical protein